jgi:hypothetical protein
VGGLVGDNAATLTDDYWNKVTSGTTTGVGTGTATGATGETTAFFKSVPGTWSSTIWGVTSGVNGGLLYLKNNPPN